MVEIDTQAELLQNSGQLTTPQAEDVALIRAATAELRELVDAVLDLSSLHTAKISIARAPIDLGAIAAEVARGLRPQVEARGVALVVEAQPDLPLVRGDAGRLRQVVTNLVGNAVKFAAHGRVTVALGRDGAGVVMAVRDDGPGIPAESMPMLFQPFEQVGGARERRGGSGLGLAICKRIVEAHGGEISVESEPGAGSTFRVRLPVDAREPRGVT